MTLSTRKPGLAVGTRKAPTPPRRGARRLAVDDGEDQGVLGVRPVGDPLLGAGDLPATVDAFGGGAHHPRIGSGVGLRHREAHRLGAVEQAAAATFSTDRGPRRARSTWLGPTRPVGDRPVPEPVQRAALAVDGLPHPEQGLEPESAAAQLLGREHGVVAGLGRGLADRPDLLQHLGREPAGRVELVLGLAEVGQCSVARRSPPPGGTRAARRGSRPARRSSWRRRHVARATS